MTPDLKRFLRTYYHLEAPVSPAHFESELARRVGTPKRRRPLEAAWQRYLTVPGRRSVFDFYQGLLEHPRERLESLAYGLHYSHLQFYAEAVPDLLPAEGRVLEVGAFTGALVNYLALSRPELEFTALEPLKEALNLGQQRSAEIGVNVEWVGGWFEEFAPAELFDSVLLLSVIPEGHLSANLNSRLEVQAYWQQFSLPERLHSLTRMLKPGGSLIYAHGPFLGRSSEAVNLALDKLGFEQIETKGQGEFSLVRAVMPAELKVWQSPAPPAPATEKPPAPELGIDEIRALLEEENYSALLALVPEEASGELAYLRGNALFRLGRYAEAASTLDRAQREDALELRALALLEQGRFPEAAAILEHRPSTPDNLIALGRAYLGLGKFEEAFPVLYQAQGEFTSTELAGNPAPFLDQALRQIADNAFRDLRSGNPLAALRRVGMVNDLSPTLLKRDLLYLGLEAALALGAWGRAEEYGLRLYDLGEASGAIGVAFARLKVRTPEALEQIPLDELLEIQPFLTDAVARSEDPLATLALGLLRHREQRYPEAIRYLSRAAREGRGTVAGTAYHFLALAQAESGVPELVVLQSHRSALIYRPYPASLLLQMTQRALQAGDERLAREFLLALRESGLEGAAGQELVELVERLEGPWEAFRILHDAISHTPHPQLDDLAEAYRLSRGFPEANEASDIRSDYLTALYRSGKVDTAGQLLASEMERQPSLEVIFDLAEHYERIGAYTEAARAWKRAFELAYYREKDLALAQEVLRNLYFLNPHDPELELYLEEIKATSRGVSALEGSPDALADQTLENLAPVELPEFHGEHLVILGGHTHLRTRLAGLFAERGLKVDWFDSDSTTSSRESLRRIESRLTRAHGVLIVSSYVGHDLSEPIRVAAESLGVPVSITSGRARGATGILRAVRDFAQTLRKKALSGSQT